MPFRNPTTALGWIELAVQSAAPGLLLSYLFEAREALRAEQATAARHLASAVEIARKAQHQPERLYTADEVRAWLRERAVKLTANGLSRVVRQDTLREAADAFGKDGAK